MGRTGQRNIGIKKNRKQKYGTADGTNNKVYRQVSNKDVVRRVEEETSVLTSNRRSQPWKCN